MKVLQWIRVVLEIVVLLGVGACASIVAWSALGIHNIIREEFPELEKRQRATDERVEKIETAQEESAEESAEVGKLLTRLESLESDPTTNGEGLRNVSEHLKQYGFQLLELQKAHDAHVNNHHQRTE